ncbi:MAG: exosortase C-terminal domain/associated protein EpsI [Planctomycetota bacterium]
MITRTLLIAVCLGFSGLAFSHVKRFYGTDMLPPEIDLNEIPLRLGVWNGEAVPVRDSTVRVIDAHSYINRRYQDQIGREISFHAAAFTAYEYRGTAPHHPNVCYPSAGWKVVERKSIELDVNGSKYPVSFTLFRRRSNRLVTMHWYVAGDQCFTDLGTSGLLGLWGEHECPCTEKYLAQAVMPSLEMAIPILSRFGTSVLSHRFSSEQSNSKSVSAAVHQSGIISESGEQ